MKKSFKIASFIFFTIILTSNLNAQTLNRDVLAKLEIKLEENVLKTVAKAEGLSKFNQSLTYELLVFSEDEKGNKNKTKQSGRFIINAQEIKKLSTVSVNVKSKKDRVIILMLIKNLDDQLLSKSRKEFIGGIEVLNTAHKNIILQQPKDDGIVLIAVVLERTKTTPGRNFYRYFYEKYTNYKFKDGRPIIVEEKHDRGRNTKIEIRVEHKIIHQFFVRPKDDYLKAQAGYAVKKLYNFFEKKEKNYIVKY